MFLLMVTYVFPFAIDDAYISLRYAENWANGYGPVFNPGERVEGYTNFLLVAIEMLLFKLGLEGLLPVKIFSILCGIALLCIVEHFTWKKHRSIFLATCAGLLVGTSSPLAFWSVGGLETTLFTLLVTSGILLEVRWLQGSLPDSAGAAKGLILFMAVLARPDAAIFVAVVVVHDFVYSWGRKSWSGFIVFLASFSGPTFIYLAWKLHFYGQIIPLPVYTKIPSHNLLYTFATGGAKFLSFLAIDLNTIFVLVILYAIFVGLSKGLIRLRITSLPFFFIATATCTYALYLMSLGFAVASDEAYRYYVPLVPLMTVALVLIWPEGVFFQHRRTVFIGIALICAMVGIRVFDLWWLWNKDWNFGLATWCFSGKEQVDILTHANIAAGTWLRANAKPDDTIVLVDAGATPYFSKLRTIDVWSLTDLQLARLKRLVLAANSDAERSQYEEQMKQYLLSRNPTFILQDRLQLLRDPVIQQKYKRVGPGFFSSPRPMFLKNTLNPFVKCRPGPYYVLELWKRVE
jgi:arabinofuranosyltransferase